MARKQSYDTLIGGSVGWNQLCNGDTVTVQNGHKYVMKKSGTVSLGASTGTAITGLTSGTDTVTDLTLLLGSTIADYIYSLETATSGAGIAKLREWGFDLDTYHAYDAGSIESVEVTEKKVKGFNQWDEEWEVGGFSYTTGANNSETDRIRSKNYCRCLPSTQYYWRIPSKNMRILFYDADKNYINFDGWYDTARTITTPSNAYYFKLAGSASYGTTYNHDICINLSSSRNGEYEPYTEQTYDYGNDTLNGIFKLDASNNLYADGDVKTSDGTITRKYGITVVTGDSDISAGTSGMPFKVSISGKKSTAAFTSEPNGICDKLTGVKQSSTWGVPFTFSFAMNQDYMYFKLSDSITTIEDAKTYLASNPITVVYELATPTTESASPFTNPQIVDPDGTEEYVTSNGVPVGHETRYQL